MTGETKTFQNGEKSKIVPGIEEYVQEKRKGYNAA